MTRLIQALPRNTLSILAASILSLSVCVAEQYNHHILPVTGNEKAVLVLCPGMNADGEPFLKEEAWLEFAKKHQLGIVAIHYQSDPGPMYDGSEEGYYWADQGSGEALLLAIETHYGKSLPILIYGFSGGAQFTSRFAEWVPERVMGWAAYSAQFWDVPKSAENNPPGIVACGEYDGARWFPSFSYFYQGRELGKPWTWVSLRETGHVRHKAFEQFVREFFTWAIAQDKGQEPPVYVDVGTEEVFATDSDFLQAGLVSWIPSQALLEQWLEIHEP
jgi:pimeloyl-ACP methyl ester carboxylesterase